MYIDTVDINMAEVNNVKLMLTWKAYVLPKLKPLAMTAHVLLTVDTLIRRLSSWKYTIDIECRDAIDVNTIDAACLNVRIPLT